jgi:hypothetical protein
MGAAEWPILSGRTAFMTQPTVSLELAKPPIAEKVAIRNEWPVLQMAKALALKTISFSFLFYLDRLK